MTKKEDLNKNSLCIGLFGTCGKSKWRVTFIEGYEQLGINYFNPQAPDWKPEYATEEAWHLANDRVILFPVTKETYATGSLAETGFSILQAIRLDDRRQFVIMVEQELEDSLKENEVAAKESLRARALVLEHLKKLRLSNLYVADSLDRMLEISITLYNAEKMTTPLRRFNPHD